MSFIDELFGYRVKVEKDGREIVNIPGILALPGALIAPKMSIAGTVVASLLGCSVRLENERGKTIDVGRKVQETAETLADTAKTAAKTVREEVEKAWNDISADDPEGCPAGEENEDDQAGTATDTAAVEEIAEETEKHEAEDVPVIHVENSNKPE